MSPDELLRWTVILAASASGALILIGGLVTPVAGRWRDGDRRVHLVQLGPYVSGRCPRPGGFERYRGWAFFGRLRLDRFEYGTEHLAALGFEGATAKLIEGRPLGRLHLRRRAGELRGTFEGRKFTFGYDPVRILGVAALPPKDRVWTRET